MSEYVHDMRQVLADLIDEKIPDLSIPVSILETYLKETVGQDGGVELLGSFVSPLVGKTVGTALVEYRHHRLCPTMRSPQSLLVWLEENGVELNRPDAYGDTAFFHSLMFEIPRMTTAGSGLAAIAQETVFTKENMAKILGLKQCNPLMVDGNGLGFLQCEGQGISTAFDGLEVVRHHMGQALEAIADPRLRWERIGALEAMGVAKAQQPWWKQIRAVHQDAFLQSHLPGACVRQTRPRM